MNFKETGFEDMKEINLVQDTVQWQDAMTMVMNHFVS